MVHAFQLRPHANARYFKSQAELCRRELQCMLSACGVSADVQAAQYGGAPFLVFEAEAPLTEAQMRWLCGHSALYMTCEMADHATLRPLSFPSPFILPQEMPEILKYKGKTNPTFTCMLLNLALSAGLHAFDSELCALDPMCGRGTTLFIALTRGMNAAGIEADAKEAREGMSFAQKFLQFNRISYRAQSDSLTLPGGKSAKRTTLRIQTQDGARDLSVMVSDTRDARALGKARFHALAADLPYGVQDAPLDGQKRMPLDALLSQALPIWRETLLPGSALAISYNVNILKRERLLYLLSDAGFAPLDDSPYGDMSHWVEQAVTRDVAVARRP